MAEKHGPVRRRACDCKQCVEIDPADGDWEGLWIDDGNQADYAAPADYIRYAKKSGTMMLH